MHQLRVANPFVEALRHSADLGAMGTRVVHREVYLPQCSSMRTARSYTSGENAVWFLSHDSMFSNCGVLSRSGWFTWYSGLSWSASSLQGRVTKELPKRANARNYLCDKRWPTDFDRRRMRCDQRQQLRQRDHTVNLIDELTLAHALRDQLEPGISQAHLFHCSTLQFSASLDWLYLKANNLFVNIMRCSIS